jgi:hypothetical protein
VAFWSSVLLGVVVRIAVSVSIVLTQEAEGHEAHDQTVELYARCEASSVGWSAR